MWIFPLNLPTISLDKIVSDIASFMKTLLSLTSSEFAGKHVRKFYIPPTQLTSFPNQFTKQRITCILSKDKLLFNLLFESERKWKNLLSFSQLTPPLFLNVESWNIKSGALKFLLWSEFRCLSGTCSKTPLTRHVCNGASFSNIIYVVQIFFMFMQPFVNFLLCFWYLQKFSDEFFPVFLWMRRKESEKM